MKWILQVMGVLAVLILGILSVSYLQHRFDQSDLKHAVEAVRLTQPTRGGGKSLEQLLAEHYQVKAEAIRWDPELESKVKGIVRVQAQVPGVSDSLVWQVDLVRFSIQPESQAAKDIVH